MSDHVSSTGRGGAGNIGHDPNTYVDSSIVREGVVGDSDRKEFSTGRGGAGNIDSPRLGAHEASKEIIPETALRGPEGHENYHTGRGGGGNVHMDKFGGHSHDTSKESVGDKIKHMLHLDKDKKEGSA